MKSQALGETTSEIEVTNISTHGFWLFANDVESFLSFEEFPWFKDSPVSKILNVEEPRPGHYYWPELDIDLSDEIIKDLSRFPLHAK